MAIMNCVDEGRLRAYLDGELPVAERDDVARHLAGCPECERQAAALRETTATVGGTLAVAGWARAGGAGPVRGAPARGWARAGSCRRLTALGGAGAAGGAAVAPGLRGGVAA